jgi:hypothetical protein
MIYSPETIHQLQNQKEMTLECEYMRNSTLLEFVFIIIIIVDISAVLVGNFHSLEMQSPAINFRFCLIKVSNPSITH